MISRYTLPEIGKVWEDEFKFNTWLKIEILACEARALKGEIPAQDLEIIKSKAAFDVDRVLVIEETTQHDVIAFLTNVAEYVGAPSRHIHYGMTSSDVLDTAVSYQLKVSGELILVLLDKFSAVLKEKALQYKHSLCIGRTHGIHAEPTTLGLKFANWYEENKRNRRRLMNAIEAISVGQISGAVGTFEHLSPDIEAYVCEKMGLKPAPVSTQVIQRDRHSEFIAVLAIIGSTLEKVATEIRHLQKTETLEAEEFFSKGQKGSSAMPHKRNPIVSERICGMARLLRGYAATTFENNALWHERDISHSSAERVVLADACIITYYMLSKMNTLVSKLLVYPENMTANLNLTRGLIFSQKILLKLTEKGLSREDAYKAVQDAAMKVWADKSRNLRDEISKSEAVMSVLTKDELDSLFDHSELLKKVDLIFERSVLKD